MTDLEEQVQRLKYQVRLLAETVDFRDHPVPSLVVELDWGSDELSKAHDIFEEYERKINKNKKISWMKFEVKFKDELSIGYQRLKSVVLAFYRNGQWVRVCTEYAKEHEVVEFYEILEEEA